LYEISERGTSWMGPLIFGVVVGATGSYRQAILALIVLFIVGIIILALTNTDQAIHDAGNATPEEAAGGGGDVDALPAEKGVPDEFHRTLRHVPLRGARAAAQDRARLRREGGRAAYPRVGSQRRAGRPGAGDAHVHPAAAQAHRRAGAAGHLHPGQVRRRRDGLPGAGGGLP